MEGLIVTVVGDKPPTKEETDKLKAALVRKAKEKVKK